MKTRSCFYDYKNYKTNENNFSILWPILLIILLLCASGYMESIERGII